MKYFISLSIIFLLVFLTAVLIRNLDILDYFVSFLKKASPQLFLSQVAPGPNEAVFYLSPESSTSTVGSGFPLALRAGASAAITSIKAYLNFNPGLVKVTSIDSTTGTVFTNWWEVGFDNTNGKIRLQASQPSPGFSGDGLVATINFQALATGTATITYDSSSLALKPDDTNILNLTRSAGASVIISAPPSLPSPPPGNGGGGGGGGGGGAEGLPGDTTPPTISGLKASEIAISSVVISWTTNEPATSQVEYGETSNYGLKSSLSSSLVASHSLKLTGLNPKTLYHFRAITKDSSGNQALSSDQTFTTLPLPQIRGDLNGDGKVNIFDLSILLSNWKKTKTLYDLSGDSLINILDLSIFLSNWTG